MSAPLRVKNDQYNDEELNKTEESDEEEISLRIVI